MAFSATPERIPCAHCNRTGTCSNGPDGDSCAICAKRGSKFRDYSDAPKGLPCSICEGKGSVEPFSLKLHNRFLPFFAMGFVTLLLIFVALVCFLHPESFVNVIGFAATLIGSITTYYFGGKPILSSAPQKKDQPDDKIPDNE